MTKFMQGKANGTIYGLSGRMINCFVQLCFKVYMYRLLYVKCFAVYYVNAFSLGYFIPQQHSKFKNIQPIQALV